jgi:magnesium transporter
METEALHDHRNQADSLPIRRGSVFEMNRLPPPAIVTDDPPDDDSQESDVKTFARVKLEDDSESTKTSPVLSIRSNTNARPSTLSQSSIDGTPKNRSRSLSLTEPSRETPSRGILMNKSQKQDPSPTIHPLSKTFSRASRVSRSDLDNELKNFERRRRLSRSSNNDSEATSRRSDSLETEEDVCFPMLPEHVRVNGIDFDEIEEFVQLSREEDEKLRMERDNVSSSSSSAAKRYTPKMHRTLTKTTTRSTATGVQFGSNRVEGEVEAPDRFSFFCSESDETVHAPDLESLLGPGDTFQELFRNGKPTWWLDCVCPTDAEMKALSKAFGIHPLTAEDIRMQETREKVELFKQYYFVCFHTFESDKESEDFLEPINIYIVVFRNGVLTFRFSPISHAANVRRRVRQLREYVDVSADWLCYALIDDITDSFAPVIHAIEYEADAIEDQVFLSRETDFSLMLQRIGESRRKVMTLMRLLSGKADVIKMFAKRCQEEAQGIPPALTSNVNLANLSSSVNTNQAQPRADIALYLGDIQDHVVTMFQNLASYEKIFSRSHSNYLAQLQVKSFHSNHQVTEMLSKVTLIGTLLVPMNLITGLFGMNVHVPWAGGESLGPFFGILGFLVFMAVSFSIIANWWFTRAARQAEESGMFEAAKSKLNFGNNKPRGVAEDRQRETKSILTFPSRFGRYD